MVCKTSKLILGIFSCILAIASAECEAGTIIKLGLGGDPAADIEFTGGAGGVLSTADDAMVSTGDQNTTVEYLDVLEPVATDIITSIASATFDGVTASGPATVFNGSLVVQDFTGGTLSLYDSSDNLLLSGTLSTTSLVGTLGAPATGGVITTGFGQFTGGSLAPYLDPNTLTLSIALTEVNGLAGLSVTPPPPFPAPIIASGSLNAFTADASIVIAAEAVPEPAALGLFLVSFVTGLAIQWRRR